MNVCIAVTFASMIVSCDLLKLLGLQNKYLHFCRQCLHVRHSYLFDFFW